MTSWKTTASGVVGGIVILLSEFCDLLGIVNQSLGTDGSFSLDRFILGLSLLGLGLNARDNKVTSEQAGAKD